VSETQAPDDLSFLGFVDLAVRRVEEEVPDVDAAAMHVVLLLHRATDVIIYDLEAGVHRPAGWTFPGFRLLFVLWLAGPMSSIRLARLTGNSRSAVSALMKTLETEGLVERRPSPAGGRAVDVGLTVAGRERLVAAFRDHNARERSWTGRLTASERSTLVGLLQKLVAGAGDPEVRSRS
jgi:DNA-binding MarR family transcriptional regulator